MFWVYVLYSEKFNKIYIGFTSDLESRLKSHNELATKGWTIKFRPWKVVFTEQYNDKRQAMIREKQLKTALGREFIWSIIQSKPKFHIWVSGRKISNIRTSLSNKALTFYYFCSR